jgi:hypothetical protein
VGLKEALLHPSPKVRRLLGMAEQWKKEAGIAAPVYVKRYQPKQVVPLDDKIGEDATAQLIERFWSGTTQAELAQDHGTSVSSVKRLLRKHGVRLFSLEVARTKRRRGPA